LGEIKITLIIEISLEHHHESVVIRMHGKRNISRRHNVCPRVKDVGVLRNGKCDGTCWGRKRRWYLKMSSETMWRARRAFFLSPVDKLNIDGRLVSAAVQQFLGVNGGFVRSTERSYTTEAPFIFLWKDLSRLYREISSYLFTNRYVTRYTLLIDFGEDDARNWKYANIVRKMDRKWTATNGSDGRKISLMLKSALYFITAVINIIHRLIIFLFH